MKSSRSENVFKCKYHGDGFMFRTKFVFSKVDMSVLQYDLESHTNHLSFDVESNGHGLSKAQKNVIDTCILNDQVKPKQILLPD